MKICCVAMLPEQSPDVSRHPRPLAGRAAPAGPVTSPLASADADDEAALGVCQRSWSTRGLSRLRGLSSEDHVCFGVAKCFVVLIL